MYRRAVYPGSFDPVTLGHMDIVERAARLFDEVILAVGINSSKVPFLTTEDRMEALRRSTAHLSNVKIDCFDGLLINYVESKEAHAIVRGLRAISDFEYEFQIAMVNRRLREDIETVFFMAKWEHNYISSSIVREVALYGGDFASMVTAGAAEVVNEAIAKRSYKK